MERMTGLTGRGGTPRHQELVAARSLVGSTDHGSLVLWGGRVAHGLRFTSGRVGDGPRLTSLRATDGMRFTTDHATTEPSPSASLPPAPARLADGVERPGSAPAADTEPDGLPSSHPAPPNQPGPDAPAGQQPATASAAPDSRTTGLEQITALAAGWPSAEGGRLLLLAPAAIGRLLGHGDHACRFQFCGPTVEGARWVSVALGGWVAAVPQADAGRLAAHFAERHPTADLFDLGEQWNLLEIDVAECLVRTEHATVCLATEDARSLLAS